MEKIFQSSEREQDSFLSIRDLVNILFKHKFIIVFTFITVAALVWWGMLSLPQVYESTGKVLVKTEQQGNPSFFAGVAAYQEQRQSDPVNRKMETEMQLVESRPIMEEVVRRLDLQYWDVYHKPYVHLLAPVAAFYDEVMLEAFGIKPDPEKYGFSDTVDAMLKSLSVGPVRTKSSETTSNIIQVSIKSTSPELAASAVQLLMEVYRDHDTMIKQDAAKKAYEIVNAEKEDALSRLTSAQETLQSFLERTGTNSATVGGAKDTATILMLKEQLLEKELELIEASEVFSGESSRVVNLKKAVAELKYRINAERKVSAETDTELLSLEREVAAAESVYLDLKKRLAQIAVYEDITGNEYGNRIIVEPAVFNRESNFKKSVFLSLIGTIAGLVLGLGLAGLKEYLDDTVTTREQVRKWYGFDVLGVVEKSTEVSRNNFPKSENLEHLS